MADPLKKYREKRDFRSTPEPSGGEEGVSDAPLFVIQEHDASSHHFDFRLQVGDVLRSWAVPKGPSTDPSDKRLAVPTEDHPLEYADFEGVIPRGYGAGTVIVWDRGTWRLLVEEGAASDTEGSRGGETEGEDDEEGGEDDETVLDRQLSDGHATFWLEGRKLRGGYALQRISGGPGRDGDERWLLIKMKDEGADARRNPTRTEPESVKTGRTLDEVEAAEGEADV